MSCIICTSGWYWRFFFFGNNTNWCLYCCLSVFFFFFIKKQNFVSLIPSIVQLLSSTWSMRPIYQSKLVPLRNGIHQPSKLDWDLRKQIFYFFWHVSYVQLDVCIWQSTSIHVCVSAYTREEVTYNVTTYHGKFTRWICKFQIMVGWYANNSPCKFRLLKMHKQRKKKYKNETIIFILVNRTLVYCPKDDKWSTFF